MAFTTNDHQDEPLLFVKMILLFPPIISNVCHNLRLNEPSWATPSKYYPQLVSAAAAATTTTTSTMDDNDNSSSSSSVYLCTLIKAMVRSLKSDYVAIGLKNHHPLTKIISAKSLNLSPREMAMFLVSMIMLQQSVVSTSDSKKINNNKNNNNAVLETCLQLLKSSSPEHRDTFVQVSVFSKRSSSAGRQQQQQLYPPSWIVQLLDECHCLYHHLCDIAEIWSQWSFVHETDSEQQYFVTQVLLCGLSKLSIEPQDEQDQAAAATGGDELTMSLLQGVTHRLESSFSPIRKNGMHIAQAIAKRLGQDLQFEELKDKDGHETVGHIDQESSITSEKKQEKKSNTTTTTTTSKRSKKSRRKGKKAKPIPLDDPDADYVSSNSEDENDDETDTTTTGGGDSVDDDNNSITLWDDEELVPYDLNDPEDDLVETKKPMYLVECLELLRTIESDDHAYSNHETALRSLPELIKSRPDNLSDIAVSLVLQLLRMENQFNIPSFAEMRQTAMTCLLIEEPILIDGGLGDRLNILAALQEAAYELSGSKLLDDKKASQQRNNQQIKNNNSSSSASNSSKEGGALLPESSESSLPLHVARIESKTRRKRSRPEPPTLVENRFSAVAPIWFYLLVAKFAEHKEKEALWRGSTGSQLLANLFRTLATIVEFAGVQSSQILGKDLFDLVWSFRTADVAEVRLSVLVSVATVFSMVPADRFVVLLIQQQHQHGDIDGMIQSMTSMSRSDPDKGCRTLALTLSRSLNDVFGGQRLM
eukprot:scaffold22583_cov106-Cylindrotheca_fusiformis.AAC.16